MKTISVIIPAYNEEKNIEGAISNVLKSIEGKFLDYEILVFDDCSKDKTGQVAEALASKNNKIKVIHNNPNKGFAFNYKKGVESARMEYIGMFPGDNEIEAESVEKILSMAGQADIIIPYTANQNIRPLSRQIVSYFFTFAMNIFFFGRFKLKYFNGPVLHKSKLIKSVNITADNFAFQAEALIKLIKAGHSYVQIPMHIKKREYGKTTIFKPKNILGVIQTFFKLLKEI